MRRTTPTGPVLLAVALLAIAPNTYAWDDFGHMEVAAVAFKHLTKKARAKAEQLLELNPRYSNWIVGAASRDQERAAFLRAATWADSIKSDPAYKNDAQTASTAAQNIGYADHLRHAYWHFVDQPFSPDGTPLVPAPAPNVATQIALLRTALAAPATSDDIKSYDLVWLLHLVGDIHQPLHCVSRFDNPEPQGDRGGNDVRITANIQPPICDDPRYCPFDPPNQLHAFFDDITGSGYATEPPDKAAYALTRPDPQKAAISDETIWMQEGLDLAQSAIYVDPIGVGDGPFSITPAYQTAALELGQRRIVLAGYRLANLINAALGQ